MWTFSWLVPACLAGQHLAATHDSSSLVYVIISVVFVVLGCGITVRFYKRMNMISMRQLEGLTGDLSDTFIVDKLVKQFYGYASR
jgi:hypothetical protein